MKKKNLGPANEDDYGPATDRLIFLEMLMEAGHTPEAVVIANKKAKKSEKNEEKT
jgi:hypothetical protein